MSDVNDFTANNVSKMKVADLKRELKVRGLNISGNKNELVDRLVQAMTKADDASIDSVDDLDEDEVLNDEEIEDEVGDYKNIELEVSDKSFELETTNTVSTKPLKRKSNEIERSDSVESGVKVKKITLNRHLTDEIEEPKSTEQSTNSDTNGQTEEKKIIKLSELSAKERLEMRAKKFGAPLSQEARKLVRAERFNSNTDATKGVATKKNTITLNNTASDVDLLKKRAERFGTIVSNQLSKIDKQEKLDQRKARFGVTTTATTNGTTNEVQKAKRLERFKPLVK